MAEFRILRDSARGPAMIRAGDAFLRALGGGEVTLRLATAVSEGNTELGLAAPLCEDVSLSPAIVLALPTKEQADLIRIEALISATAVAGEVERRGMTSAEQLFAGSLGLVRDGRLLCIESVTAELVGGAPAFYRIVAAE